MVFKMAASAILDFENSNFYGLGSKRPILYNRAKFCKDRSICCCDMAIAILDFQKFEILNVFSLVGLICIIVPDFIKISQTVAEIWQFNGFQNDGLCRLGFWKFKLFTVWAVKRPILHNRAKFREDCSIRCCDSMIFVIFKMVTTAILDFQKFEILTVDPLSFLRPDALPAAQPTASKHWRHWIQHNTAQ